VIIGNLHVVRVTVDPTKAQPKLIVDPDAVLAVSVTSQLLEPITRWATQIVQARCCVEQGKLALPAFRTLVENAPVRSSFASRSVSGHSKDLIA
jgi:hypothetical protein